MLIRQPEFIRDAEKSGIKVLNFLNKMGKLKSQRPLEVNKLADKMVKIAKQSRKEIVSTYIPKDLFK